MNDPLSNMPSILRRWADKRGLDKLLRRYGWSICEVCGRIGYRWTSEMVPSGHNLEFESLFHGWIHPHADGWEGEEQRFGTMGQTGEKEDRTVPEVLMADFFDLFMKGVCNTRPLTHGHEGEGKNKSLRLLCVGQNTSLETAKRPRVVPKMRGAGDRRGC